MNVKNIYKTIKIINEKVTNYHVVNVVIAGKRLHV